MEYDAFTTNRPENRLLKATLQYLYKHSVSSKNRNDIKILLNSFAEVEASVDYKSDFTKYVPDRNMKDYTSSRNRGYKHTKIILTMGGCM